MYRHHSTDVSAQGVIILSPSCEALYISPMATQLIRPLETGPTGNSTGLIIPAPLRHIGQEVRHQLQASLEQGNGLTCEVKRALLLSEGTLFIQGLGVANQHDGEFLTALVVSKSPIHLSLSREA